MRNLNDFPNLKNLAVDSMKTPVQQQILHWICTHESNETLKNVFRGAAGFKVYRKKKLRGVRKDLATRILGMKKTLGQTLHTIVMGITFVLCYIFWVQRMKCLSHVC